MPKTELTKNIEQALRKEFSRQGVFCCEEVTIGWYGKERVDFMTYDTNDIFRCFEIKITKSDFKSKAAITFCGDYNYYVLTPKLYEDVVSYIAKPIGIYVYENHRLTLIKKPQKQKSSVDRDVIKNSFIRSLAREANKYHENFDELKYSSLKAEYNETISKHQKLKQKYNRLLLYLIKKLGYSFWHEVQMLYPHKKDLEDAVRKEKLNKFELHRQLRTAFRKQEISEIEFEKSEENFEFDFE